MKRLCASTLLLMFVLAGCSPTETVFNAPESDWQLLALTDESPSRLVLLDQPSNIVSSDNLFKVIGASGIGGRVSKIVSFREYVYVILPEQRKIEVLSSVTYQRKTTLDFSASGKTPVDIIFANATTGYIAFSNSSVLSVVDVTVFKVALDIEVGQGPIALAVQDNQVFCALQRDNSVAFIDSRTNTVAAKIPVPQAPTYMKLTVGGNLAVLSLGGGKIDNSPRTPGRVSIVSISRRVILGQTAISIASDSTSELPRGMAVTESDFAYIPLSKTLIRVDTRRYSRSLVMDGKFSSINYNPIRTELLLADSASCTILNPETGELTSKIPLSFKPNILMSR